MKVSLFDFDLPEERIALHPAKPRDAARMLVVEGGAWRDRIVRDLPAELRAGDVLVINETRVFPASLTGVRKARAHGGGGDVSVDVNLHKPVPADGDTSGQGWMAFVRPAKRLKVGDRLHFDDLTADVMSKSGGEVELRFDRSGAELEAAFERVGQPPLPPYIARKRALEAADRDDYQTVYADRDKSGSVAAPTAGLHFTPDLFEVLGAKGVQIERLTLHVGAGTFLPMTSEDTDDHVMHSETLIIDPEVAERINAAKQEGRRIIAVGTTSLRALEGARTENGRLVGQTLETDIFITPGYVFRFVDGLMTNFHLPKSTLFMLVCAFAGLDTMQAAYAHAMETGYRFYSYGDSSLLWRAS